MKMKIKDILSTKELYSMPVAKPGGGKTLKVKKLPSNPSAYGMGTYGAPTPKKTPKKK